jgi:hypothetical protein
MNVTQGSTTLKPLLKLGIQNGRNVVRFDGTDDYMDSAALGSGQALPTTWFIICPIPGAQHAVDGTSAGSRQVIYGASGFAALYGGAGLVSSSAYSATVYLWTATFNGASSTIHRNGVSVASGNAGSDTFRQVRLAARQDGVGGFYLPGDISEVIVYTRALTVAVRQSVEAYLMTKWGLS